MQPLIPPPPPVQRQDRRKIGLVALVLLLGASALFLVKLQQSDVPVAWRGRPIPEEAAAGALPSAAAELKLPSSYGGLSLLPPPAPPPPAPSVPITKVMLPVAEPANPFVTPPAPPPPVAHTPAPATSVAPPAALAAAKPTPKPPSKWLFADLKQDGGVQEPPFPVPKGDGAEAGGAGIHRAEGLFPQAVWGTPADPTKVLYRSQVLKGLMQHDVQSDQPGLMRILVTEEVQDRFGQGHVLVPQYTILLGAQDGKVSFGASTLGMVIDSMEFPDGTVVALTKAKAGDATGATGVPGDVNNHWGRVLAGAGITALLAIGTRVPAGNQQGFAPTIGQEVAGNAGGSIATSGQQIVQRELSVRPTITIPYGTPVTVQLTENVNFQTPVTIIRH